MYPFVFTGNFCILDLIDEAIITQNADLFNKADSYRIETWKNILKQQHDLIMYGGFSYEDVERIPIVERELFMDFTIERKKQNDESFGAQIANSFAQMMGLKKKQG